MHGKVHEALSPPGGEREAHTRSAGCRTTTWILTLTGPDGSDWFACPSYESAVSAVDAALKALAASGTRRMRDLPPTDRAALVRSFGLAPLPPQAEASAAPACGFTDLGDGRAALVLGSPFGRCGADSLDRLADQAEALSSDIHLSPRRGFVLVAMNLAASRQASDALAGFGFITTADDPRTAVAACPGAPACASGSTPTLAHAGRLAEAFRPFAARGLSVHVSGCAKGCAHPGPADLTLVGVDGRYGLVLGGGAGALPAMRMTFEAALERVRRADPTLPLDLAFRTHS
jgi:precorrin-3B synthase